MSIRIGWLLYFIGFACILVSCGNFTSAKPAAEKAVKIFHQQYNSQDWKAIYENSHENFQKSEKFEKFEEFMKSIHSKLGKVQSTENQNWRVGNFNLKTNVSLVQQTKFEQGVGAESFVYRIKDEKAILVGYNINSRDLIIK